MNHLENKNSRKYLEALYDSLIISIQEIGKKIIEGSALFTIMKMYSNDVYNVMLKSSIEISDSVMSDLEPLKQNGYIKLSELSSSRDNYIITAKGIYFVESNRYDFDIHKILNYIQQDKMDFKIAKKPLTDKEKVIMTSLIALRAFDKKTPMDLNEENKTQKWEEIIKNEILPFIDKRKIIEAKNVFSQNVGHENPISYLMRRANDLPKKTSNIFTSLNNNQYYLEIEISDKYTSEKQIAYLLSKIFQNIEDINDANDIKNYLCNVAQTQGIYVYDNIQFINFDWDKVIINAIDKLYLGLNL